MSSYLWPALPAVSREIQAEPDWNVMIHRTISGREDRTSVAAIRMHWRLTYQVRDGIAAPNEWAAYSEKAIIEKFENDHVGSLDSFLFVDPKSPPPGTQKRVRFEAPPQWKRVVTGGSVNAGVWSVEVRLVEVLSGDQATQFTFDSGATLA